MSQAKDIDAQQTMLTLRRASRTGTLAPDPITSFADSPIRRRPLDGRPGSPRGLTRRPGNPRLFVQTSDVVGGAAWHRAAVKGGRDGLRAGRGGVPCRRRMTTGTRTRARVSRRRHEKTAPGSDRRDRGGAPDRHRRRIQRAPGVRARQRPRADTAAGVEQLELHPAHADDIHGKGLKFGLYVTPGISHQAVVLNTPIEGTPYHAADIATTATERNYNCRGMVGIDYSKPGAQEFINSWANQFASWDIDY